MPMRLGLGVYLDAKINPVDPNQDLKDLIQVYYKCNEASGARVDSGPNALDLTDNNSTGSATGKVYSLAAVTGDDTAQASLTRASAAPLQGGAVDFTIACWFKATGTIQTGGIFAKAGAAGWNEWSISDGAGNITAYFGNGTSAETPVNSTITASDGIWRFAVAWYDTADGKGYIRVDDVTQVSLAVPTIATSTVGIGVGKLGDYGGAGYWFTGAVGPCMKFSAVLTAAQRTRLWNNGDGLVLY